MKQSKLKFKETLTTSMSRAMISIRGSNRAVLVIYLSIYLFGFMGLNGNIY